MRCRRRVTVGLLALLVAVVLPVHPVQAAGATVSLSGSVYEDADRDGVHDTGEALWPGRPIDLFDATGRQVAATLTDSAGRYVFAGIAPGRYTVAYTERAWWDLRSDWVPTTTGSLRPQSTVDVSVAAAADLGLRRIVRSAAGAPLSRVVGADGLVVESYNDAVTAAEVHAAVEAVMLRGAEAGVTTVQFDLGPHNVTGSSVAGAPGTYRGFSATIRSAWLTWLEQADASLVHEYGHAWSLYHDYVVQQDGELRSYLAARGLTGDPRLGTSHAWSAKELIAEDYRQLFGSATASVRSQENTDVPAAVDVPGLAEFLRTRFTTPPAPAPAPAPAPSPVSPVPAEPQVLSLAMNPSVVSKTGTASWALAAGAVVTVEVLDGTGRAVRRLFHGPATSGSAVWDRKDEAGGRVRGGAYVLRLHAVAGGASSTRSVGFSVR